MSPDPFTSESRAVPNLRRWAPFFPLPHDAFPSVIILRKLIYVPWNSLTFTDPPLIQNSALCYCLILRPSQPYQMIYLPLSFLADVLTLGWNNVSGIYCHLDISY